MSKASENEQGTKTDEPVPFDPDDAIGYIEGQPKPDPNAGWLKRLWYRFTGVLVK